MAEEAEAAGAAVSEGTPPLARAQHRDAERILRDDHASAASAALPNGIQESQYTGEFLAAALERTLQHEQRFSLLASVAQHRESALEQAVVADGRPTQPEPEPDSEQNVVEAMPREPEPEPEPEPKLTLQQRVAAARYVPLAFAEYLDMEESVLAVLRKQQDNRPRC